MNDRTRRLFVQRAGLCGVSAVLRHVATGPASAAGAATGLMVTDCSRACLRWTLDTKLKPPRGWTPGPCSSPASRESGPAANLR